MPPPMGRTTPEGTAGITVSKTGGQGLSPRASQPKATARVQPENGMHGETQPRRTTEGGVCRRATPTCRTGTKLSNRRSSCRLEVTRRRRPRPNATPRTVAPATSTTADRTHSSRRTPCRPWLTPRTYPMPDAGHRHLASVSLGRWLTSTPERPRRSGAAGAPQASTGAGRHRAFAAVAGAATRARTMRRSSPCRDDKPPCPCGGRRHRRRSPPEPPQQEQI
jgi:hypothetical protein